MLACGQVFQGLAEHLRAGEHDPGPGRDFPVAAARWLEGADARDDAREGARQQGSSGGSTQARVCERLIVHVASQICHGDVVHVQAAGNRRDRAVRQVERDHARACGQARRGALPEGVRRAAPFRSPSDRPTGSLSGPVTALRPVAPHVPLHRPRPPRGGPYGALTGPPGVVVVIGHVNVRLIAEVPVRPLYGPAAAGLDLAAAGRIRTRRGSDHGVRFAAVPPRRFSPRRHAGDTAGDVLLDVIGVMRSMHWPAAAHGGTGGVGACGPPFLAGKINVPAAGGLLRGRLKLHPQCKMTTAARMLRRLKLAVRKRRGEADPALVVVGEAARARPGIPLADPVLLRDPELAGKPHHRRVQAPLHLVHADQDRTARGVQPVPEMSGDRVCVLTGLRGLGKPGRHVFLVRPGDTLDPVAAVRIRPRREGRVSLAG